MVVWGAASMPMTPPLAAQALMTSSGFRRLESHRLRAPACVMKTGLLESSIVSMAVTSPEWLTSMARPSLFMRSTALRPKAVRPPSRGSLRPAPRALPSLYAMPMQRTPRP